MNQPMYRFIKQVLGAFAMWITRQSPYIEDISPALAKVNDLLLNTQDVNGELVVFDGSEGIKEFVKRAVYHTPEIAALNKSKAEQEGEKVDDNLFVSRYHRINPRYDFVDLEALCMNISKQLIEERV